MADSGVKKERVESTFNAESDFSQRLSKKEKAI